MLINDDGLTCECGHEVSAHVSDHEMIGCQAITDNGDFCSCPAFRSAALVAANRHLGNLLARIHRDGGHYQEAVGTDRAVQDADAQIIAWLGLEAELGAVREQLRLASAHGFSEEAESNDLRNDLAAAREEIGRLRKALERVRREQFVEHEGTDLTPGWLLEALKAADDQYSELSEEAHALRKKVTELQEMFRVAEAERFSARDAQAQLRAKLAAREAVVENLCSALDRLMIDTNRLCDRNLGGSYEEDCQRSIEDCRKILRMGRLASARAGTLD